MKVRTSISLDDDVLSKTKAKARKNGLTLSSYLNMLLTKHNEVKEVDEREKSTHISQPRGRDKPGGI